MLSNLNGAADQFLADLNRIDQASAYASRELSSGLKVQLPSDAPGSVGEIVQINSEQAAAGQVAGNLAAVQTDLQSADPALQQAVQLVENAIQIASQNANTTVPAGQRPGAAPQASGLLAQLVSISNIQVNGRYIFSGDQDQSPAYQLDSTNPVGAAALTSGSNTREVYDANGVPLPTSLTAQQIFDARDGSGNPAAGNVFAAVQGLVAALQNDDGAGVQNALSALQAAHAYLGTQLQFYGAAETRVSTALTQAQQIQTRSKAALSTLQDADPSAAASALMQAQTDQQTALAARAQINRSNLFDYLG